MPQNPVVLIVEDCPTTGLVFEKVILTQLPSCRPIWAKSIAEAKRRAGGINIALFVVDVHLPDGSGLDFLLEMSNSQPDAQAIVMSATPLPEYEAQSAALGAVRFLEKPVYATRVQGVIEEVLSASMTSDSDAFRASLKNLTLLDVLQIKCLSRSTTTLKFASGTRLGLIHLVEGEITHAQVGECTGVGALEEMVCWRSGTAHELATEPEAPRTIHTGWQALIMRLAQMIDEIPGLIVT